MATVVTKEHLAIVDALRTKYLKVGDSLTKRASRLAGSGSNISPSTDSDPLSQPTQEVPSMEVHPTPGEGVGGQAERSSMATGPEVRELQVMESVDRCVVASIKPSSMINDDNGNGHNSNGHNGNSHNGKGYSTKPTSLSTLTNPSHQELTLREKRRGRWLAVALRVEFDPQCLNLSYADKARLIGLAELCGNDEEELIYNYTSIINDVEFVTNRKKALDAFEQEMDVPTAVCIADAARRDPQYAIMRRRIRQLDKKQATLGDQKDQFGQLYDFLHGRTETVGDPPRGDNNGQVTEGSIGEFAGEGDEGADSDLSESSDV